ncbi:4-hydroxyproline epimerase [Roseateles violae]|uniref:4-hydroxyproline epimerase n=1 Tax=Roseateles violae TaxID=3058042 RepID=A0ABT8E023_9BURK|nr:4-hydroxyproline epimerase [Pelomonas sp. PFR6]MDN3923190.1 4-hydroxyproline epimerase [Pelomonas sp. PFR6]
MPLARFIDSHTGGEPTRLLVSGGPDLGGGSMAARLAVLRERHDRWRRALVNEPRGSEVLVGGIVCEPQDPANVCGILFFNNVGYLGMCGHGTIGLIETLHHLGRIAPGSHRIETPVGLVTATLHEGGEVSVENVPSYRHLREVAADVPGIGTLHGDIAWGGNWFFLCADHGLAVDQTQIESLTGVAQAIREALRRQGIRGADGAEIDHVELLGPPGSPAHDGRAFVLCPGGAYDRSPCGTGTSAKLACLAAEGLLQPGQTWHQESVIGSVFKAHYAKLDGEAAGRVTIRPTIRGRAHVTLDAQLLVDAADPFAWGL